jgi:hypothetical protein
MSESTEGGTPPSGSTPAADFTPITSQADLNKIISERVTRERAKFADYNDVKAKADRLDQIEKSNQTEAERTAQRIADLETEIANSRLDSARHRVAAAHGITDAEDIALFLTGTDEDTLTKQAQRLADRTADRMKQGNKVPPEGGNPKSPPDPNAQVLTALFGGGE